MRKRLDRLYLKGMVKCKNAIQSTVNKLKDETGGMQFGFKEIVAVALLLVVAVILYNVTRAVIGNEGTGLVGDLVKKFQALLNPVGP